MKDLPKSWEFNELRRDVEAIRQGDTVMRVAVADLSQDVKVVKATVTDNIRQVNELEHRVTRLEAAAWLLCAIVRGVLIVTAIWRVIFRSCGVLLASICLFVVVVPMRGMKLDRLPAART